MTLEQLRNFGINTCATLQSDARDQPPDLKEIRDAVAKYERGQFQTRVSKAHQAVFSCNKSRKVTCLISSFHADTDESDMKRWIRNEDNTWERIDLQTSGSIVDYNSGYANVDSSDSATYVSSQYNRRSRHWWRHLIDFVLYKMIMTNAWLVYRCLHTSKKTTLREFELLFCMEKFDAPWFSYSYVDKDAPSVDLRGRKRFTGKPIATLTPAMIRAEFGPRTVGWDRKVLATRNTQVKRARKCMDYRIIPTSKRSLCCCEDNKEEVLVFDLVTKFFIS